ncbi:Aminoglycoside phosphotransferase [Carbonactinospora thermoautotrophica]|uniref:Aminoglycoside phosphotransferase n=1 Tax=Carbonactinospora thermoautotrophica TaxID=1469144 RepID=A0A132MSR8_9ACTN|nr:Aminoglycoside phosphotransferase [Carbonactinospora thermoautotrophica]
MEQVSAAARRLVEGFLGRTPPAEPHAVAFCHNDLGSEHVLVDVEANTVTGVIDWTDIDWTDAAIADPVHDIALIYRDLGPEIFDLTLAHYEGHCDDADRERAVFYARCSLLEDIAYGVRHRRTSLCGGRSGTPRPDLRVGCHVTGPRGSPGSYSASR